MLNGIDASVWDPNTDPKLVKNFTLSQAQSGKKANKRWLCKEFGLDPDRPLFVFIGRLVGEKGADLFPELVRNIRSNPKMNTIILGSGNKQLEKELKALEGESFAAFMGYDESLAHKMYAGADFLLMPSRVEPCGLNQMYALRYGTVPIVNPIGGLKDTVTDLAEDGFGIRITNVSVEAMLEGIERALAFYEDQKRFKKIRKQIMQIDHSWNESAEQYFSVYKSVSQ
ncbi:MAG: glycosyltransferase [Flavobacteriales bacterium]|nr:glycosyltransferase [Flavobacteriales bacterium]